MLRRHFCKKIRSNCVHSTRPIVLTILDGWGYRPQIENNAIALARKPIYDKLLAEFPNTLLHASDHFVGLPDGQMGNSEVGHLNIGAGRVVRMDITRIDALIASGEFFSHPTIVDAMKRRRRAAASFISSDCSPTAASILNSDTSMRYSKLRNSKEWSASSFTPLWMAATRCLLRAQIRRRARAEDARVGVGKIASVSGRYYAMDRDRRWEREKLAFDAMVAGKAEGGAYADPIARIKESYNNGITDEFIVPFVVTDEHGHPNGVIGDGDVCIMFNYRADRARQITRVLARNSSLTKNEGRDLPGADDLDLTIPRNSLPRDLHYVCMTQYDKLFTLPMILLPESMENLLANMLAQANLRNLRIAETEKYAHVTYFFNGGIETPFPGEDRLLVPSQKVATYDLAPEMSAAGIADVVVKAVEDTAFDLLVVNFANADMVGHSGKLAPTIKGVETVDACLGRIYQAIRQYGGSMLITADHGNAEMMVDPISGGPHTAHTTNPVPFIFVNEDAKNYRLRPDGSLRDISPTVLGLLGLVQPTHMSGGDLRVRLR